MPTVYITAPPDAASELARALVEQQLAACVNRVPCHSVYRWDATVHEEDEEILLAKTTEEGFEALQEWVEHQHPYDVPCIERFDEDDVLQGFANWISEETGAN